MVRLRPLDEEEVILLPTSRKATSEPVRMAEN